MIKSNRVVTIMIIVSVAIFAATWVSISYNPDKSDSQTNQQSAILETESEAVEEKKPVEETELARYRTNGTLSADEKYFIKNVGGNFPKIVSAETSEEFEFKPGSRYARVYNLKWSPDGQTLAYFYQIGDEGYKGLDILNTIPASETIKPNYSNAQRIIVAGKLDFQWIDDNRILFSKLTNFDDTKKFYKNGSVDIYNAKTEKFENPMTGGFVPNVYSMELADDNKSVLYVQAILDVQGFTEGREYIVSKLNGAEINSTDKYDPNWSNIQN